MAALKPRAQPHDSQAEKQETGRDDVRENAEIGIAVVRKKIDREQKEEGEETAQCDNETRETRPVAKRRGGRGCFITVFHVWRNRSVLRNCRIIF